MADSIHTVRWIEQISDQGWDIHLFPCDDLGDVHPQLRNVTVHHSVFAHKPHKSRNIKSHGIYFPFQAKGLNVPSALRVVLKKAAPSYRVRQLDRLINGLKPDVIHSLEFQHAGYMTMQIKRSFNGIFPKWVATNWGSDIYLFGRLSEHRPKIQEVLANCDYYSCECDRDVELAKAFGFKGDILPVLPNTGGFDLEKVSGLRQAKPSERRLVMLKGYQHWAGRALVGLRALERCADILKDYTIVVYNVFGEDVKIASELLSASTGIDVRIIPAFGASHGDILQLHGQARTSIGVSISDGISTSFLEALVMGSLPIQSCTACATEWIEDGKTGIIVPTDDPDVIEQAIRRALTDDNLVDRAAEENWKTAVERLDHRTLKENTIGLYEAVMQS